MTRGLSSNITTELGNQNIKAIALNRNKFSTPQRLTNHYKEITHNSNTYTASSHLLGIVEVEIQPLIPLVFQIELSAVIVHLYSSF